MKKKAHELDFISQINRDGSGTTEVSESYLKSMLENKLMKDEDFEVSCLSLSEGTFIATNFNSFVVRLKKEVPNNNKEKVTSIVLAGEWFKNQFDCGKMPYNIQKTDHVVCSWSDFHDGEKSNIEGKQTIAICKNIDDAEAILQRHKNITN